MADPYQVLGVSPSATDAEVRQRYLALIREFTPEQHPERFAEVRQAYELIGTLEDRAEYHLYEFVKQATLDELVKELRCRMPPRRITLDQLTKLAATPG